MNHNAKNPGGTIFNFNLVGHNYEHTYPNNIDLHNGGEKLSYYYDDPPNNKFGGEQEVLLMPYFMFTILGIKTPEDCVKEKKEEFETWKKDALKQKEDGVELEDGETYEELIETEEEKMKSEVE